MSHYVNSCRIFNHLSKEKVFLIIWLSLKDAFKEESADMNLIFALSQPLPISLTLYLPVPPSFLGCCDILYGDWK